METEKRMYNNVNEHIGKLMQQRQNLINLNVDTFDKAITDKAGFASQAKAITEMKIDEARRFYLPFNK